MKVSDLLRLAAKKLHEPMERVRRHGATGPGDVPPETKAHVELAIEAEEIAKRLDSFLVRAGELFGRG